MYIEELILENTNQYKCGQRTIGELVNISGKQHLWSMRSQPLVDVVVIHYISAFVKYPSDPFNLEYIIEILCELGVSSHYIIDRSGKVFHCVPDDAKAWHAGGSIMPYPDDRIGVNDFSIGIELMATESSGFTDQQYASLAELCRNLERTKGSELTYVGHEHVAGVRAVESGLRNEVKIDPGELFNWDNFFARKK